MTTLKATLLAAIAMLAFASPSFAQNFHGFGAPSSVTENGTAATQTKPVMLKAQKHATAKHAKTVK
jgi:hypothetical protein